MSGEQLMAGGRRHDYLITGQWNVPRSRSSNLELHTGQCWRPSSGGALRNKTRDMNHSTSRLHDLYRLQVAETRIHYVSFLSDSSK